MGFGKSSSRCKNNDNNIVGQGVLQGSSSDAPIFSLNSEISLCAYNKSVIGASFCHPVNGSIITDHSIQYVDDTSQFLNNLGAMNHIPPEQELNHPSLLQLATKNSQKWADLMWMSGGNLNLGKCFFYAFQPSINYKSNTICYYKIPSDSGISITNPAIGADVVLQSLNPDDSCHTLGVILSPDGQGKTHLKITLNKAKEFYGKFMNSSVSQKAKWAAISTVLEPAIIYPLVNSYFSMENIKPIDSILSQMKCVALGLNRHFPRVILHGPLLLGGLGIPSSLEKNAKDRLNYFLFNTRCPSTISSKFDISIVYTQIEIGTFEQFFSTSYHEYGHLVFLSYCVQIRQEMEPQGIIV